VVVRQISNHLEWSVQVEVRGKLMESSNMILFRVLASFEVPTEAQWIAFCRVSLCCVSSILICCNEFCEKHECVAATTRKYVRTVDA
jgi:hypothetical protein